LRESNSSLAAFAVLESLAIYYASCLPALTQLLKDAQCFPKEEITVDCHDICTAPQLAAFLQVVIHPLRSEGLWTFDLCMDSNWENHKTYDISVDTLQPLLALRHLRTFRIHPGLSLHIEDSHLKEMAQAWPEMTTLDLETIFPSEEAFTHFKPKLTVRTEASHCFIEAEKIQCYTCSNGRQLVVVVVVLKCITLAAEVNHTWTGRSGFHGFCCGSDPSSGTKLSSPGRNLPRRSRRGGLRCRWASMPTPRIRGGTLKMDCPPHVRFCMETPLRQRHDGFVGHYYGGRWCYAGLGPRTSFKLYDEYGSSRIRPWYIIARHCEAHFAAHPYGPNIAVGMTHI
jgi:hypothetical protein